MWNDKNRPNIKALSVRYLLKIICNLPFSNFHFICWYKFHPADKYIQHKTLKDKPHHNYVQYIKDSGSVDSNLGSSDDLLPARIIFIKWLLVVPLRDIPTYFS